MPVLQGHNKDVRAGAGAVQHVRREPSYYREELMGKGMAFFDVLLLVFIVLKLCHVITWRWIWVLSPFWIGCLFVIILYIVLVIKARDR